MVPAFLAFLILLVWVPFSVGSKTSTPADICIATCGRSHWALVLPIAQEALQIGATCLWQQLGVENSEASTLFLNQGRHSVTNRCVKIEHARIFGGLNWVGVNTGIISAKRPID
jgi:hypothetical protein